MKSQDYILAHKRSKRHKEELKKSKTCSCFYCLAIFKPNEIEKRIDEFDPIGKTALCPKCRIDFVIGSESGYPITKQFLKKMRKRWF